MPWLRGDHSCGTPNSNLENQLSLRSGKEGSRVETEAEQVWGCFPSKAHLLGVVPTVSPCPHLPLISQPSPVGLLPPLLHRNNSSERRQDLRVAKPSGHVPGLLVDVPAVLGTPGRPILSGTSFSWSLGTTRGRLSSCSGAGLWSFLPVSSFSTQPLHPGTPEGLRADLSWALSSFRGRFPLYPQRNDCIPVTSIFMFPVQAFPLVPDFYVSLPP